MKKNRFGDPQGLEVVVPWMVRTTQDYSMPVHLSVASETGAQSVKSLRVSLTLENAKMLARALGAAVLEIEQARADDDALSF